jgi:hypothetical protein
VVAVGGRQTACPRQVSKKEDSAGTATTARRALLLVAGLAPKMRQQCLANQGSSRKRRATAGIGLALSGDRCSKPVGDEDIAARSGSSQCV